MGRGSRVDDADYTPAEEAEVLPRAAPVTRFSTSVTTGQGGPFAQHAPRAAAPAHGFGGARLGNRRAPVPTCSIGQPGVAPPSITLGLDLGPGAPAPGVQIADAMLGAAPDAMLDTSVIVARTSGSLESTQSYERVRAEAFRAPACESSDTAELAPGAGKARGARPGKERKKVGRPIEYEGDPDSPHLTEAERRRIKRRISNRESARRVRHKRQEIVDEMQANMDQLRAANSDLLARAQQSELEKRRLAEQLAGLEATAQATAAENARMQAELRGLRQTLQMKMSALEAELDKRLTEADGGPAPTERPLALPTPTAAEDRAAPPPPPLQQPLPASAPLMVAPSLEGALSWLPALLEENPLRAGSLSVLDTLLDEAAAPPASAAAF